MEKTWSLNRRILLQESIRESLERDLKMYFEVNAQQEVSTPNNVRCHESGH